MTKRNSTKRALLASALSLLLCFSMLVGTTFAWFTDSVTSAGNIIKSGDLKVLMHWADGTEALDDTADWKDASAEAIFKSELWEPGYVDVKHIRVTNDGTLALKYQLFIEATGEVEELADVIDVYVIKGGKQIANRAALANEKPVGTLSEVIDSFQTLVYGDITVAEKSEIFTIALKMREDADSYYENMSIGSEFAIKVLATQFTDEEDSFDDQYDADAAFGTYVELPAGGDLLEALASAEEGMPLTIKLLGDVEWPTPAKNASDITPASAVVINGNGNTITAVGTGVYAIGDDEAPITLKDLTVVDESYYTSENGENAWEFTYLELCGNNTYVNVNFTDGIMVEGGDQTFINCSFVGHTNDSSDYGNVTMNGAWVLDGSATFTGCTFEGTRGIKVCDKYNGNEIGSVVIDGCRFIGVSEKPGVAIDDYHETSSITIKNSTFIGCQPGDAEEKGEAYGVAYIYETDNTKATLENNTVDNETKLLSDTINVADIANAKDGDVFMLATDAVVSGYGSDKKMIINSAVTLDLNGKTLTTECGWGGIDAKGGCTIKNGTINHTGNTAAIKAFQVKSIENVTINVTETAGKTKGGIVVQNGDSYIESIKNVTITGATNGIECYRSTNGEYAIGSMENVKIDATQNGIYINGSGIIGSITNCEINAGDIGINAYLANLWHVSLKLENSKITAGRHGIDIWDEAKTNTGSTVVFEYDDATTFVGGTYDVKVTLQEEITCTINGEAQSAPCTIYVKE